MPAASGCRSGLDALRIALIAAGLERGEEVIVPAMTFVATLEAVTQAGGIPVVADIQEADLNLDPDAAAAAITGRTRFVLPVHLYGQLADMRRLGSLGLPLIEDACQAPGAVRDGLRAGTGGLAAAFSFYPSKNLGAMGDAGALVTDNDELADRALALREHGQRRKYEHESGGIHRPARHDAGDRPAPQAAAARALERRAAGNRDLVPRSTGGCRRSLPSSGSGGQRARLASLRRSDGRAPTCSPRTSPNAASSRAATILCPVHLTEAYAYLGLADGSFPVAEALARQCLSLPIFPGMREDEVEHVVAAVKAFFDHG